VKRRALWSSLGALLFAALVALGAGSLRLPLSGAGSGGARLVSLSPAITETVIALGAAEHLVGISEYCELPPSRVLPRIGTALTPNYEAIVGMRPSLILCDDSVSSKKRELAALARSEFLPWLTLPEVVGSVRRLGEIVGRKPAAEDLAYRLERRLSRLPSSYAPRVLFLISFDPARPGELWFVKRNSLHGSALAAAGGRNAVDRDVAGLPRLGLEELLQLEPDLVILMRDPGAKAASGAELVEGFSRVAPLRAVRERRVGSIDALHSVGPSILKLMSTLELEIARLSMSSAE
jgi:iron complex transport system substrate-binding protein